MLQNDLAASYAKQDQDRQLERMTIQRQQQQFLSPTASNKPQELFRSLVPPELSPSPLSNELSLGLTSTNSCLGPQPVASSSCYNHSIASAADPRQQPQIGDELHSSAAFRHSSASVDHKSLNLTNFSQQQQLLNNNPAAAHNLWAPSDPHRSEHYANYVINSARRSNSFLQALDRQAQARQYTTRPHHHHHHQYHHQPSSTVLQKAPAQVHFSRKRLSVNLSSYPTRHRHLLTPVGPPPKPPMPPTQRLSEGPQPKAATADEQPSSCTGTLTDDLGNHQERRGRSAPRLRFQGELHQVLVGMEQRQDNADSLENIQMIVDEESPSYAQSIPQQQQQQQQQIVTVPQLSPANEYNENMGTIKLVRTPRSSSSPPPPPPPLQVPTMILDDQNLQLQERAQQGLSLQVTNKKAPLQKTNSNSSSTSGANYLKGAEHAVRFDDLDSSRLTINNDTESQRPARRSGQDSHGGRRSRIYPSHEESQLNEEDEEEDDYSRSSRRRGQSSERPCRRRQATPYIFSEVPTTGDPTNVCAIFLTALSLLLVLVTFPFSLFLCIKVVQEYERVVIFRLGRLLKGGARGPGIFFIIPCIDSYCKVDLRTVSFDVPPQEILSRDSVTVAVDAVVYYRISNATIAVANVENYGRSTRLLAATTLRNVLGTKNLSEILSEREIISHIMQASLDEATEPWGVKVERVEIKDVRLPVQLQRAMAAEAEAAREARAKVIAAEGEQKASKALRNAAEVISKSPQALQLRYLQTLNSIAAEKNSTIVFPLPLEIFSAFGYRSPMNSYNTEQNNINQSATPNIINQQQSTQQTQPVMPPRLQQLEQQVGDPEQGMATMEANEPANVPSFVQHDAPAPAAAL